MDLDESEVSRLLRGDVPSDDPEWGGVSRFLDTVGTVYPAVPSTASEARHLAAVARESRLMHSELRHPRRGAAKRLFQGTHRVLAGSVAGFLIVLTAGVGVASAFGVNPLGQLLAPQPAGSSAAPDATSPAGSNKDRPLGTVSPATVPSSVPTPTGLPTPSPTATSPTATKTPGSVGDEHKNSRATEKANNAATPTPHRAVPTPPRATPKPRKATPTHPAEKPTPPGKDKKNG